MSLRYWWKDLDKSGSAARNVLSRESFKPLSATTWYSIKSDGILKSTRGKRGGMRPRLMESQLGLDNISTNEYYNRSSPWWCSQHEFAYPCTDQSTWNNRQNQALSVILST